MAFSVLTNGQLLSNSLVVDNSVMMCWLFNDGSETDQQYAQKVLHSIETSKAKVIAPYIWVYEASFVVNFYTKKGKVSHQDSRKYLDSLFDLCQVIRGEETPKNFFLLLIHMAYQATTLLILCWQYSKNHQLQR